MHKIGMLVYEDVKNNFFFNYKNKNGYFLDCVILHYTFYFKNSNLRIIKI